MIEIVSLDLERQDIINAYRFKLDKELDVYIAKLDKKRDREISYFANRHSEEETSIYKKNRAIFYQDCIEHKKAKRNTPNKRIPMRKSAVQYQCANSDKEGKNPPSRL